MNHKIHKITVKNTQQLPSNFTSDIVQIKANELASVPPEIIRKPIVYNIRGNRS